MIALKFPRSRYFLWYSFAPILLHQNLINMKLNFMKLYCVLLIAGLSASCTKMTDADQKETGTGALNGIVGPVPPYTWTELPIPGQRINYPFYRAWSQDIIAPAGGTYFLWTGNQMERVFKLNKTTMRWEAHPGWKLPADLLNQHKVLFYYQGKVYYSFDNYFDTDFHALDPILASNRSLAPFPDQDSIGYYPHSFVVGDNGYIFFDYNHGYWKYNFPTNTWTRLGENPFYGRKGLTIEVANGKVYAGMGYTIVDNGGTNIQLYQRDWSELDPETGTLTPKAQFPFFVTSETRTCVVGDNIYVGFGKRLMGSSSDRYYTLYKYDISANRWSQCQDYPGDYVVPSQTYEGYSFTNVTMFSLGNAVFVVSGGIYQWFRYANTPLVTGTSQTTSF